MLQAFQLCFMLCQPLRHVSEINYAKWEVFAETIKRDEELEKERKEAEAADYRRTLGGCAHDNSQVIKNRVLLAAICRDAGVLFSIILL